jgi:hypothetical protein
MRGAIRSFAPPNMVAATRMARGALALPFLTAVIATYAGAALTWDGASLLFALLDTQEVSLPHARLTVALFQYPTLLASRFSSNVRALQIVYGLTYTLLPAASALASWQLVRRTHPRLVVWPLLWLGVGAVPGQIFFVTESLIATHAAFPLLLAVVTGLTPARGVFCLLTAIFMFGLHPVAGPLLLLVAAASAACAIQDPSRRRTFVVAAALLFCAGATRIAASLYDPYELSQAAQDLGATLESLHLPWLALVSGTLIPLAMLAAHLWPALRGAALGVLAAMGLSFAYILIAYAFDARAWQDALNYRFIAPFAAVPFLVGAAIVTIATPRAHCYLAASDGWAALAGATLFATVLCVQSVKWLELRDGLDRALARGGCVSMSNVPVCRNTALRWWPTPSYALLVQGRAPRALLLPAGECGKKSLSRVIPVNPWYVRPRDSGWFDLTQTGPR